MTPDDKIDPLGPYRGIRPVKEGSVFAKFKIKKKPPKKEENSEEKSSKEKEQSEHKIDIEV
ncbi:MAG: hypothetical protein QMD43_01485 [Thermodesulfovibrio sp.]|uniref:hypothetical protein n=1 Tax=unclassified Thermodesulfovibrio TaxID=2645936 RepID=UPI00083B88B3|nr:MULTISPECIES: hypothetical protein [unclassified Thermodesulfovibrio]MDI1471796.1 hypothetical protein [Thermodesulfovibrio sp. 1176]MDI6713686.1 hypothetical protein [Thermodesulfovibrio sp.]ODA44186.1 hypothetical protein THER_1093 [Thermodesulfovibrio sp. N1]